MPVVFVKGWPEKRQFFLFCTLKGWLFFVRTAVLCAFLRGRTVRCARAVRALCEKLAVLHHREFGKFRRLKGRH